MPIRNLVLTTVLTLGMPGWASCGSAPGIDNFGEVGPNVYRGAQPTEEGIRHLAKIGVKVVVDLRGRGERSVAEERMVTSTGMRYVSIPMSGLSAPTPDETKAILTLLENPSEGPVFVHCLRGADRTGAVIAAYRIDHDKWDNARALKEAMANGMSLYQLPRQRYIRTFQGRATGGVAASAVAGELDGASRRE